MDTIFSITFNVDSTLGEFDVKCFLLYSQGDYKVSIEKSVCDSFKIKSSKDLNSQCAYRVSTEKFVGYSFKIKSSEDLKKYILFFIVGVASYLSTVLPSSAMHSTNLFRNQDRRPHNVSMNANSRYHEKFLARARTANVSHTESSFFGSPDRFAIFKQAVGRFISENPSGRYIFQNWKNSIIPGHTGPGHTGIVAELPQGYRFPSTSPIATALDFGANLEKPARFDYSNIKHYDFETVTKSDCPDGPTQRKLMRVQFHENEFFNQDLLCRYLDECDSPEKCDKGLILAGTLYDELDASSKGFFVSQETYFGDEAKTKFANDAQAQNSRDKNTVSAFQNELLLRKKAYSSSIDTPSFTKFGDLGSPVPAKGTEANVAYLQIEHCASNGLTDIKPGETEPPISGRIAGHTNSRNPYAPNSSLDYATKAVVRQAQFEEVESHIDKLLEDHRKDPDAKVTLTEQFQFKPVELGVIYQFLGEAPDSTRMIFERDMIAYIQKNPSINLLPEGDQREVSLTVATSQKQVPGKSNKSKISARMSIALTNKSWDGNAALAQSADMIEKMHDDTGDHLLKVFLYREDQEAPGFAEKYEKMQALSRVDATDKAKIKEFMAKPVNRWAEFYNNCTFRA